MASALRLWCEASPVGHRALPTRRKSGSLYQTVGKTQGGIIVNKVIVLDEPGDDLTVTIGPVEAVTQTVYDSVILTYRGRNRYGNLLRLQYFMETTPHGAVIVCQLRFSYVTLDILLNVANASHRDTLAALSKQPTLPVVEFATNENGGRDLSRRHFINQPMLVRRSIQHLTDKAITYNAKAGLFLWQSAAAHYVNGTDWYVGTAETEQPATPNGTVDEP